MDRLPKTISQKVLRGTVTAIVNEKPYKNPPTIEDPATLEELIVAVNLWREAKAGVATDMCEIKRARVGKKY